MNNFNFGEVLTRAWQNIWKHKVLWIFGILASCARGSGGSSGGGALAEFFLRLDQVVYAPIFALFFVGPAAMLIETWRHSRRETTLSHEVSTTSRVAGGSLTF